MYLFPSSFFKKSFIHLFPFIDTISASYLILCLSSCSLTPFLVPFFAFHLYHHIISWMEVIFYSHSPSYPTPFSPSCCLPSLLAFYFYFLIFIINVSSSSAGSMSEVLLILSGWSSVASTLMRKGTRCLSTSQTLPLNTRMNFWDAPKGSSLLHWLTGRVNQLR